MLASPGLRLLRLDQAPMLISFLQQEFRSQDGPVNGRPQEHLISQLAELLQAHESAAAADEIPEDLSTRARRTLERWANEGLLIRAQDATGQEWYDLTPATGQTLLWLDTLDAPAFAATDSRFLDILRKLQELVRHNSADKATRLAELHRRQAQLAAEIEALEAADELPTYSDSRIAWEVASITQLGKSLREDFRVVDENFQALVKDLYERQLRGSGSRGHTLGFALDSREALKQQDQGRSFYTFWEFLTDPAQQAEFDALVADTYQLLHDKGLSADDFLRNLRADLFEAARVVRDTSLSLTERLHRLVTEHDAGQRRRALAAFQAIQQLALQARDADVELPGVEVSTRPIVRLPLARRLADSLLEPVLPPPAAPAAAPEQPALLADDLAQLFGRQPIDRRRLADNITAVLAARGGRATLTDVLDCYPLEQGLGEVLAYLALAAREPQHLIDENSTILVPLDRTHAQALRLPHITFCTR
ncbi:hypothetical protein B0919_24045 [Hymenobacter sp. CRA2]|nr:hypothetical protein B0919_24045 [Hymenobacter sp. CRA2]